MSPFIKRSSNVLIALVTHCKHHLVPGRSCHSHIDNNDDNDDDDDDDDNDDDDDDDDDNDDDDDDDDGDEKQVWP